MLGWHHFYSNRLIGGTDLRNGTELLRGCLMPRSWALEERVPTGSQMLCSEMSYGEQSFKGCHGEITLCPKEQAPEFGALAGRRAFKNPPNFYWDLLKANEEHVFPLKDWAWCALLGIECALLASEV
jgi:hypothetical protein